MLLKIKKVDFKTALYKDSMSYFATVIILFVIPLVALYPDHSALRDYAKPFFLFVWLGCCISLKIVLNTSDHNMNRFMDWLETNMPVILSILICAYILFFFGLAKLKYDSFGGYMTDDAHFMQFFHLAYKGGHLEKTVLGDNMLGTHLSFILYIFLLPYFVYPSVYTILFLKAAIVGLSGIPLYLIIKKKHNSVVSMCIVLSYLLFHQVAEANIIDFHEVIIAPFFLLYTYYFFKEGRFGLFMMFFLLSLSIKENMVIVLFVFGIYALLLGRSRKWILTPLIVSCSWVGLGLKIVLPYFSVAKSLSTMHVDTINRLLGFLKDPMGGVGHLYDRRWMGLIYTLFQPVLFVGPLLSMDFIFVVPWVLIKIVIGGCPQVRTWHFLIIAGFLFIAFADSLKKIESMFGNRRYALATSVVALFICVSCFPYWLRVEEYIPKSYIEGQKEAIKLIPDGASVCAPEYMLSYLVNRGEVYNEVSFQKGIKRDIDFIIFDSHIKEYRKRWESRDITPEFIKRLRELAPQKRTYLDYGYYWDKDGIFIYRNKGCKIQR